MVHLTIRFSKITVIPAQAGILLLGSADRKRKIPACAGMTSEGLRTDYE